MLMSRTSSPGRGLLEKLLATTVDACFATFTFFEMTDLRDILMKWIDSFQTSFDRRINYAFNGVLSNGIPTCSSAYRSSQHV